MTTSTLLRTAWDPSPLVLLVCALALSGYALHGRGRLEGRAALFALGTLVFWLALASPLAVLARGYLFSAHMLQHLLLLLAVPPLALLGLPRDPRPARGEISVAALTVPWLAGVGGMWIWHVRALCDLAVVSGTVRAIQTASLVGLGVAFWRPVLGPRSSERAPPLAAALYLFAACLACTVLGIAITLSPVALCPAYAHPVDALGVLPLLRQGWGLSCEVDQQIGGLLMWVPACFVYAAAILASLARYYREEHAGAPSVGGTP